MISSDLISNDSARNRDNNNYLIFAGFCLIAAIFSRRFINTIGERILEAAKKAVKTSQETKQELENTQLELTTAEEQIEDIKLTVDLKNVDNKVDEQATTMLADNKQESLLIDLTNSYIQKTDVPDLTERLKLKAELGRRMGEIIVRNNLSKVDLFSKNQSEGMILALAYSIQLKPNQESLDILNKISKIASQLYTKHKILTSYETLIRNNYINSSQVEEIRAIITGFRHNADVPLLRKIEETLSILNYIKT
jgi:hypothetical protein